MMRVKHGDHATSQRPPDDLLHGGEEGRVDGVRRAGARVRVPADGDAHVREPGLLVVVEEGLVDRLGRLVPEVKALWRSVWATGEVRAWREWWGMGEMKASERVWRARV